MTATNSLPEPRASEPTAAAGFEPGTAVADLARRRSWYTPGCWYDDDPRWALEDADLARQDAADLLDAQHDLMWSSDDRADYEAHDGMSEGEHDAHRGRPE